MSHPSGVAAHDSNYERELEERGDNLIGLRLPSRHHIGRYLLGFLRRVLLPQAIIVALFAIPVRGTVKVAPDYLLPLELTLLVVYLSIFAVLLNYELRQVASSDSRVRWIESLMVLAAFFVSLFARLYTILGAEVPNAFSEPMGTLNGFYYAVTVFSTVGFGDITPEIPVAKLITMVQMLLGIGLIGLLVRVLSAVAKLPGSQHTGAHRSGERSAGTG